MTLGLEQSVKSVETSVQGLSYTSGGELQPHVFVTNNIFVVNVVTGRSMSTKLHFGDHYGLTGKTSCMFKVLTGIQSLAGALSWLLL